MDTQIQAILNRGFMQAGELLDPLTMRPYINARGMNVVAYRDGVKQNAEGKMVPILKEKPVFLNALLRKYDWEKIDAAVIDVMRQPLVGISDLLSAGLTNPLGGIGVSISTYEQLSDMSPADVSMSVTPRKGQDDRVAFTPQSIPVPVISKPFSIDIRTLSASQRGQGESLDVTQARVATLKVRESLEDMLFNGSTISVNGFPIYGYTNHPHRDTAAASAYGGGDFGTDGNAHKTIVGMIAALVAQGCTGPWGVYVATTQHQQLNQLTGVNLSETQLSVIKRTIEDIRFIRRAPRLADGQVLVVQMTQEVVDLSIGMDVTPVSWQEYGGMVNEFRVMTAAVPRIKFDANNVCGVAHATGA